MVRALFMKDVRLIKKNLMIMLVMIIGMPVFFNWRLDAKIDAGAVPLSLMVNILGVILLGNICTEEEKYPGGEVILLCAPCSKKMLVAVRYLIMSLFSLLCIAGYETVCLIMGRKVLYIWQIMQALSIYILLMGFFIPVIYKVGVMKVQYLLTGTVVVLGFFSSAFINSAYYTSITAFIKQNQNMAATGLGVFCIIFILASYFISFNIYDRKECV